MTTATAKSHLPPIDPVSLREELYAAAYAALETGDATHAEMFFASLAFTSPADERGWLGLSVCCERNHRPTSALRLLAVGAMLVPSSQALQAELARVRESMTVPTRAWAEVPIPLLVRRRGEPGTSPGTPTRSA